MMKFCANKWSKGLAHTPRWLGSRCFAGVTGRIVGVDLGTTNSVVAVVEGKGEKPRIIENLEGQRTTPSFVAFSKSKQGEIQKIVGSPAKRQSITNPDSTFYAFKRLIGRRYEEKATQDIAKHLSYEVVKGDNGDAWVYSPVTKTKYSPSQLGGYVLQAMKESAEAYLGSSVNAAVVTVPAYFNDSQRQATKDAGQIAGLDVKRLIAEPTAAAFAYGLDKGKDSGQTVAVYDLGGGTFDISILELSDGVFEVRATNGDTALGGEDFDHVLLKHVIDEFKKETGIDLSKDNLAVQRMKTEIEKCKIELSSTQEYNLHLAFITADETGAKHLDMTITRAKLEALTDNLVQRTMGPCEKCMKDADLKKSDITEVLLVGGQTRMPKVVDTVQKFFGRTPSKSVNPDEVVAAGAALQGGVLQGDVDSLVLIDVTPLSLGLETLGGVFTRLIDRNTAIPTKKSEVFSTAADNQTQVGIKVYQGEREMAADNKFLGSFDLVGIPPSPRGRPQIEVTFDIDANGIVNVSAKDKITAKEQTMQIRTDGGLSKEEIQRMQDEASQYQEEDRTRKETAELKNQADTSIWQAEQDLEQYKDKITSEVQESIKTAINNLKEARDGGDKQQLESSIEELKNARLKIGEAIYGSGQQQGASEASSDSSSTQDSSTNDQQTVDAEFEEKKSDEKQN